MNCKLALDKIRSFFWPIYRKEVRKVLPLFILYALICFNYSILKIIKDGLVVTAPGSGAESIPFLKIWGILPMALLIMYLFTRLFNRFSQERVFYIMTASFLLFFVLFITVLHPLRDIIHPHALATQIQSRLPPGFSGLISIFRNWSYSLFYIMSELWGTAIMSVLFWGFANEITTVKDAKRFYGILMVGANLATIASAQLVSLFTSKYINLFLFPFVNEEVQYLTLVIAIVTIVGLLIIGLFRWYHVKVIDKDPHFKKLQKDNCNKRREVRMGMRKSFLFIAKSKYLICIAVLVIAFNLANNMVEIIWKDQIKALYPGQIEFTAYIAKVHRAIGIISTLIGLFFCSFLIQRLGWTISALMTPLILLITGIFFFGVLLCKDSQFLANQTAWLGITPLAIGVFLGTLQNVLSRSCKYTLFDTTKEIAFIPLSNESKIKGKAAIDGIGSRLGKSGGSILHQVLLMSFGTVSLSTPIVGIFLLMVTLGWIVAVQALGRRFTNLTTEEELTLEQDSSPNLVEKPSNSRATV